MPMPNLSLSWCVSVFNLTLATLWRRMVKGQDWKQRDYCHQYVQEAGLKGCNHVAPFLFSLPIPFLFISVRQVPPLIFIENESFSAFSNQFQITNFKVIVSYFRNQSLHPHGIINTSVFIQSSSLLRVGSLHSGQG